MTKAFDYAGTIGFYAANVPGMPNPTNGLPVNRVINSA